MWWRPACTVELHWYGLIATASHPDKQIIRIIGFFFENGFYIDSLKRGCNYFQYVLPSKIFYHT